MCELFEVYLLNAVLLTCMFIITVNNRLRAILINNIYKWKVAYKHVQNVQPERLTNMNKSSKLPHLQYQ